MARAKSRKIASKKRSSTAKKTSTKKIHHSIKFNSGILGIVSIVAIVAIFLMVSQSGARSNVQVAERDLIGQALGGAPPGLPPGWGDQNGAPSGSGGGGFKEACECTCDNDDNGITGQISAEPPPGPPDAPAWASKEESSSSGGVGGGGSTASSSSEAVSGCKCVCEEELREDPFGPNLLQYGEFDSSSGFVNSARSGDKWTMAYNPNGIESVQFQGKKVGKVTLTKNQRYMFQRLTLKKNTEYIATMKIYLPSSDYSWKKAPTLSPEWSMKGTKYIGERWSTDGDVRDEWQDVVVQFETANDAVGWIMLWSFREDIPKGAYFYVDDLELREII